MFHAESLRQWRDWLQANHDSSSGVWLVVWKKHTGKPALEYSDTVDEALAYGWIDSRTNRLDDERATRWFCPRKPTSPWSRINRAKIARLVEERRLQPAGQALVDAARENGAWTISDEIEDLRIPDDLAAALESNPAAGTSSGGSSRPGPRQLAPGGSTPPLNGPPKTAWPTIPKAATRARDPDRSEPSTLRRRAPARR